MKNLDAILHVRGESRFVDDEPVPENVLYAAVVASPLAHGRLLSIETAAAGKLNGVRAAFTSRDIPGANQIGNVIQDEPLLATEAVHCVGQPVALVVATTEEVARRAARLVKLNIEPM
ncbi:MAG: xanthine dehydrogenase, partial [Verrucomicrobiia bacterium]